MRFEKEITKDGKELDPYFYEVLRFILQCRKEENNEILKSNLDLMTMGLQYVLSVLKSNVPFLSSEFEKGFLRVMEDFSKNRQWNENIQFYAKEIAEWIKNNYKKNLEKNKKFKLQAKKG